MCSVSFYDAAEDLCFTVDWSLLMPVGSVDERNVYDFEIGLASAAEGGEAAITKVPAEMLKGTVKTVNNLAAGTE